MQYRYLDASIVFDRVDLFRLTKNYIFERWFVSSGLFDFIIWEPFVIYSTSHTSWGRVGQETEVPVVESNCSLSPWTFSFQQGCLKLHIFHTMLVGKKIGEGEREGKKEE